MKTLNPFISYKMMTFLNSLYCQENHQWEDDEEEEPVDSCNSVHVHNNNNNDNLNNHNNDDDNQHELSSLISKESNQHLHSNCRANPLRRDAAEWILRVVSHYSFTASTAVMSVNYLDRFLDRFEEFETEKKPWMIHLAAVACISLAAKVEETRVPLLLDLQIDGSKYVFEPKTVQKMEILVLTTLGWKMNPVTPLSFIDYVTRRLGFKSYISDEFIKRCECLILCFLPDGRFRCYLPSVMAAATMVHVINSVEPCIGAEFQTQLLGILGINKEEVDACRKEIRDWEVACNTTSGRRKRKFGSVPGSPDDVMDLSFSSDESWSGVNPVSSSPEPGTKKSRNDAT